MSEQNGKNDVALRKNSGAVGMRSSLSSIFSRPKSLNVHPDLKSIKKSQSEDGTVTEAIKAYESRTPDTVRRHRKISSVRRPNPQDLLVPSGQFRGSSDGISDLQLNKAILRSQISTDHESQTDDEFGPDLEL